MTGQTEICIIALNDGSFASNHDGKLAILGTTLPDAVNALRERGVVATHWLPASEHAIALVIDPLSASRLTEESGDGMDYDSENPICIVQRQSNGTFAYADDNGEVIELGQTLPGAVEELDKLGIVATHWLPKGEFARMTVIPSGVARYHLTDEQKAALPRA
jgi:hypothetical protein